MVNGLILKILRLPLLRLCSGLGLATLALAVSLCAPLPSAYGKENFVAVIIVSDLSRYQIAHEAFLARLKAQGVSDEQLRIYVQTPNADTLSLNNAVRKAVGVGADMLVTYGAQASMAARKESGKLPVFFGDVYDPVGLDLVHTVGLPVKNMAGVSSKTPLETLIRAYRDIHSGRRVGILFTPEDAGSSLQQMQLAEICRTQGLAAVPLPVKRKEDISTQIQTFATEGGVLFVGDSPLLQKNSEDILDLAKHRGLPVLAQIPGLAELGALVTIEADPAEQGELLADQVQRVLEGGKAEDVPLRTPRKVALVINLQVAQRLQLTVPFQALKLATRVIR